MLTKIDLPHGPADQLSCRVLVCFGTSARDLALELNDGPTSIRPPSLLPGSSHKNNSALLTSRRRDNIIAEDAAYMALPIAPIPRHCAVKKGLPSAHLSP